MIGSRDLFLVRFLGAARLSTFLARTADPVAFQFQDFQSKHIVEQAPTLQLVRYHATIHGLNQLSAVISSDASRRIESSLVVGTTSNDLI